MKIQNGWALEHLWSGAGGCSVQRLFCTCLILTRALCFNYYRSIQKNWNWLFYWWSFSGHLLCQFIVWCETLTRVSTLVVAWKPRLMKKSCNETFTPFYVSFLQNILRDQAIRSTDFSLTFEAVVMQTSFLLKAFFGYLNAFLPNVPFWSPWKYQKT